MGHERGLALSTCSIKAKLLSLQFLLPFGPKTLSGLVFYPPLFTTLILMSLRFFLLKMFRFERQSDREMQRWGYEETEAEISDLPGHLPTLHNTHGRARPQPGTCNSIKSPMWVMGSSARAII